MATPASFPAQSGHHNHQHAARGQRPPVETTDAARVIAEQLATHNREMRRLGAELKTIRDLKESLGALQREAHLRVQEISEPRPRLESAWAEVAVGLAANRNPDVELDAETTTLITDILECALTNVAQHAGASETNLSVKVEDHWIFISVFDDGRGGAVVEPGHSLAELQARVNVAGGHFSISSPADRGTLLTIALPSPDGDTAAKATS